MSNKASTFVVLGFVLACCGGWSPTVVEAKNDEAFQETVRGYARESLPDATIVSRFTRLSEQGDPRATLWLARLHWGGRCGLPKEPGIAYDLAEPVIAQVVKLAEEGDHEAQFLVLALPSRGICLGRGHRESCGMVREIHRGTAVDVLWEFRRSHRGGGWRRA